MTARRAERTYALLLRAYPPQFRAAYEREMRLTFRDLVRAAGAPGPGFWMRIIADVVRTAPMEHADALRARWNSNQRMEESRMKPMGTLAVAIGLLQSVNAIVELTHGGGAGLPGFVVVLAVVLGVMLVVTGVALLRGAAIAPTLAALSAVCWLALVVIVRAVYPWMSIFSMLLAVVFPIALLVYVWMGRGRGRASTV